MLITIHQQHERETYSANTYNTIQMWSVFGGKCWKKDVNKMNRGENADEKLCGLFDAVW